jgi:hypothetical protein
MEVGYILIGFIIGFVVMKLAFKLIEWIEKKSE